MFVFPPFCPDHHRTIPSPTDTPGKAGALALGASFTLHGKGSSSRLRRDLEYKQEALELPRCPSTHRGAVLGHVTLKDGVYQVWQSWEREISPGLRQAGQKGWVAGQDPEAAPCPRCCNGCGDRGARGTLPSCPKGTRVLGERPEPAGTPRSWGGLQAVASGQAQLLAGLAHVQGWDRSSSPRGAGTCARTDPTPCGAGTCGFRTDLSQLAALVTQQSRAWKGEIYDFSMTLQIAESDGKGFLLHSQALKNPVGSPAMALSQHDNHPQAAVRGSSWCRMC